MLRNPMYSISYHKREKFLRLTWLSGTEGMTDHDFKETLEVFADSALQHHANRLMIDMREFRGRPSAAILAWRDEVTVPKYIRAGTKRIAWLWPGMTADNTETKYENRYFETEKEAMAWIVD